MLQTDLQIASLACSSVGECQFLLATLNRATGFLLLSGIAISRLLVLL